MRFVTSGISGAGGAAKLVPEDFAVDEVPLYEPGGEGEHLFVWVEKRQLSTPELARELAAQAGVDPRQVSWAGLKDRHAVTRQYLCLPARAQSVVERFTHPLATVLAVTRHRNKLRVGHLRGNRFRLRLRDVREHDCAVAALEQLEVGGVPNYFGEQRFGRHRDNAARGRALLAGRGGARGFERKMLLSALQSELFNRTLDLRLDRGLWVTALTGDVLKKTDSGGEFVCVDPAVDQPRLDRFEIGTTGPLFGPKMLSAEGEAAELEQAVLAEAELGAPDFRQGGKETLGARRHLRVRLTEVWKEREGGDLCLGFFLPAGSYATVVLGEIMKHPLTVAS